MEDFWTSMPPVTRAYLVGGTAVTLLTTMGVVKPVSLFLYWGPIFRGRELWRLLTSFLFVDRRFSLGFFFHMYFFLHYSAPLERSNFGRSRRADFVWFWIFSAACLMLVNLVVFYSGLRSVSFLTMEFLGPAFTSVIVYVWSRKNPFTNLAFFGLFMFTAPYLPAVLLVFNLMLGGSPTHDVLGYVVGHLWFFFDDVLPHSLGGKRILAAPAFLKALLDPPQLQAPVQPAAPVVAPPPPPAAAAGANVEGPR